MLNKKNASLGQAVRTLWVIGLLLIGAIQVGYFFANTPAVNSFIRGKLPTVFANTSTNDSVTQATPTPTADKDRIPQGNIREQGEMPLRIIIPSVNIDLPIVYAKLENGTWSVVDGVANFAEGTALPNGETGNTGIFGHDRPKAFNRIKSLKAGEQIIIETENYRYSYTVITGYQVEDDAVRVFYPTEKASVTLLTCNGLFSEFRYVINAELSTVVKTRG
jgi:LPXTG-site transpeptidase (sortase) family protein